MRENAVGKHLTGDEVHPARSVTDFQLWLYRFAMHRGYLDATIDRWIVRPFTTVFRWCDGMERRWTNLLSGGPSRESDQVSHYSDSLEDVA
jgi:NAD(P)H-quinone oxidoreductase subunit 5